MDGHAIWDCPQLEKDGISFAPTGALIGPRLLSTFVVRKHTGGITFEEELV